MKIKKDTDPEKMKFEFRIRYFKEPNESELEQFTYWYNNFRLTGFDNKQKKINYIKH